MSAPGRLALLATLAGALVATACADPASTRAVGIGERVGTLALLDLEDRPVAIEGHEAHPVTVLWFWSTLCPCVAECEERIVALLRDYGPRGMRFVALDSNDGDDATRVRAQLRELNSPYEVRRDPGARQAARLGVRASASVVVLDREGRLRYRGAVDDDLRRPTVSHVRAAVDAVLAGRAPVPAEVPSYGCVFPLPETE